MGEYTWVLVGGGLLACLFFIFRGRAKDLEAIEREQAEGRDKIADEFRRADRREKDAKRRARKAEAAGGEAVDVVHVAKPKKK